MVTLPEGYRFSHRSSIAADEVIRLRQKSDWGTETRVEVWEECIARALAVVGARDKSSELVGVGFLAGNLRHAVLCDFTVLPEHRGKGIGTAILEKRVEIANQLEIPYLYTELVPENPLRQKYLDLGFVASGNLLARQTR